MPQNDDSFIRTVSIRVRYCETDKMGIVYNANYLTWFEIARTEYCRRLGRAYKDWEALGYFLPVTEAYCRYRSPAGYDDLVELNCRAPREDIKPHSIRFEYTITREGKILAEGWTKHAFVNAEEKIYRKNNQFQQWLLGEVGRIESE
jgi:acyl-CoA thioester hydrolase